jgi:hypothetical protein
VATVVVFFFNTNSLPSIFALQAFSVTMNKKEGITIIAFFLLLLLLQKRKQRQPPSLLCCNVPLEEEKEGDIATFAMLQRYSRRGRRR